VYSSGEAWGAREVFVFFGMVAWLQDSYVMPICDISTLDHLGALDHLARILLILLSLLHCTFA
jgi:hypothetical protein